MFELTICYDALEKEIIDKYTKKLTDEVKQMEGVFVSHQEHGNFFIGLAVPMRHKKAIKEIVIEIIAKTIVEKYKKQELDKYIMRDYISTLSSEILIAALAKFDENTDINLVKKHLIFNNYINICSYYHFKMDEVKNRWKEIGLLVSRNIPALASSGALISVLKFLISSIENKSGVVQIYKRHNHIELLYNSSQDQKQIKFEKSSLTLEYDLISSLISISPEKIIIHKDTKNGINALSMVFTLFDNRIQII